MDLTEKFEDLPRKTKMREGLGWRENSGSDYPWKRVFRFLLSRVGQDFDRVTAIFVNLTWIPPEYRTYHQLARYHVETNTFRAGKDIYFNDHYSYHNRGAVAKISEQYSDLFYVNPDDKTLAYHPKGKKINWKIEREKDEAKTLRILGDYWQLLKLNGIWYEVKGQKVDTYFVRDAIKKGYATVIGPKDRLIKENEGRSFYKTAKVTYKKELSSKELKKFGLKNDVAPVRYGRLK